VTTCKQTEFYWFQRFFLFACLFLVLKSEVEDLKIVLHSADKELETIKKTRDLESIESGRTLASLESKV
jgi:hypothetical protein